MSQRFCAGLPPWASPEKALSMFPVNSELSVGVGSMNQTLACPLMFTSPPLGQPSPSKSPSALPPQLPGSSEFIVTVMSRWLSAGADGRLRLAITCSQPSSAASTPARAASAFAPKIVSKPSPGPRFVQTMLRPVVCSTRFSGQTSSFSSTGCGRAGRNGWPACGTPTTPLSATTGESSSADCWSADVCPALKAGATTSNAPSPRARTVRRMVRIRDLPPPKGTWV
jgi:hypothetical protein